jgi:predicted component of type VI protein secretion system
MTCPSCGAINSADFSFCLQCGHPLSQSGLTENVMSETRADMAPVEAGTMAMEPLPATMSHPGGEQSGSARLRVDQGSVDDPVIGLDRPLTVIGRRQGSDIVIHDTNVSRMHAQIKRDGSRLVIEDTNSSNGTIVNDEKIEKPCELQSGDVIRIGDAVFVLEVEEAAMNAPEGSTMAIDLESPMTSLGGIPELVPPGLSPRQPSPLTPPPAIMDPSHTALSDSLSFEDEVSPAPARPSTPPPVRPITPPPAPARPDRNTPPPVSVAPPDLGNSTPRQSASRPAPASTPVPPSRSTTAALESLRRELSEVGEELGSFSGTLGGLADRVERLERALDSATGDLDSVADAIRGPDAAVLMELQGILADIERGADGPALDEAIKVLEQLSAQPRDIELLLKLSQQAGAIESALRIHGRLVAAAPNLRTSLARLTS